MGSVKDLKILKPAFEKQNGEGEFVFSDRYSIFDWGEMPDDIPDKGKALCIMAAYNFEKLEETGISTHYLGLVSENGKLIRLSDVKKNNIPYTMRVKLANVYKPVLRKITPDNMFFDYSFFAFNRDNINNYLIGLEVIFRNALPVGSSVFKKIEKIKSVDDEPQRQKELKNLLEKYGLEKEPKPDDFLPKPVINFTTKLEPKDRELDIKEAFFISGLNEYYFNELISITKKINDFITKKASETGFLHYDGKVEFAFNNGIMLCDVLGTLDENRFGYNGKIVSKEILRQWYKKNQPEFKEAIDKIKNKTPGWQKKCKIKPKNLPKGFKTEVGNLYKAACNKYTGLNLFDVPDIDDVLESIKRY